MVTMKTQRALEELNLQGNKLKSLSGFNHASLKVFNARNNKINTIENCDFSELEEFDLCGNPVSKIKNLNAPKLKIFWLEKVRFKPDSSEVFNFSELIELDINGSWYPYDIIACFACPNLQILEARGVVKTEKLKTIPAFDCPKLKKLDLGNHEIGDIYGGNVKNINELRSLESLVLLKNKITLIHDVDLPDLKILKASQNSITDFDGEFPSLENLDLYGNKLAGVPRLKLPRLTHLNLAYNNITYINIDEVLEDFPALMWIDISGNYVAKDEVKTLRKRLNQKNVCVVAKKMREYKDTNEEAVAALRSGVKRGRISRPRYKQNKQTSKEEPQDEEWDLTEGKSTNKMRKL